MQKWAYTFITVSNKGKTEILRPDGAKSEILNEHINVTLNKLGADGWELVQSGTNTDSSGSTYILKRLVPPKIRIGSV